ncbi:MAG: hypothetical protein LDL41_01355 [Coleofasciculus sp. S288]|nr:hypothetical protein [Coleofasciculus sp. S288]
MRFKNWCDTVEGSRVSVALAMFLSQGSAYASITPHHLVQNQFTLKEIAIAS